MPLEVALPVTNTFVKGNFTNENSISPQKSKHNRSVSVGISNLAPTKQKISSDHDFLIIKNSAVPHDSVERPGYLDYLNRGLSLVTNVVSNIVAAPAKSHKENQEIFENDYLKNNLDLINFLKTPQGTSISHNDAIGDLIISYGQRNDGLASYLQKNLRDQLTIGENIARALFSPGYVKNSNLIININNNSQIIEKNIYTVRALCWYMLGVAASQDVKRRDGGDFTMSDMTTSGSFIMKDPDNRIYDFLNSSSSTYHRTSTHFAKRLGHNDSYYFLNFLSTRGYCPDQRGIEDYRSLLPIPGGALLFDKLKAGADGRPELFVKFEAAGCPAFTDQYSDGGLAGAVSSTLAATVRNAGHALHFVDSKSQKTPHDSQGALRQEHVHKGVLKPLHDQFIELINDGKRNQIIETDSVTEAVNGGITDMCVLLKTLAGAANKKYLYQMEQSVNTLLSNIIEKTAQLGKFSDHYKIKRQGAEVHISLNPSEVDTSIRSMITTDDSDDVVNSIPFTQHENYLGNLYVSQFANATNSFVASSMPLNSSSPATSLKNMALTTSTPEIPFSANSLESAIFLSPLESNILIDSEEDDISMLSVNTDGIFYSSKSEQQLLQGGSAHDNLQISQLAHGLTSSPAWSVANLTNIPTISVAETTTLAQITTPGNSEDNEGSVKFNAPVSYETGGMEEPLEENILATPTNEDENLSAVKAVRTRSRSAVKNAATHQETRSVENDAKAYDDWSSFKLDWSELFGANRLNRLAFWR
ncbi:hypothetical protein [Ottowia thiooxydans]|uniref:hypothetical protein n=1 Tax=Ottowia thiooxydans TaxID=219182 RepID=UPI00041B02B2|nr:hypothetical protein [Ottowia thiooxydans]